MKKMIKKIILSLLVFVALAIFGLGWLLVKGKTLSERHEPFVSSASFDYNTATFDEYIKYSQDHLRRARVDTPSDFVIRNASPFVLKPAQACARSAGGGYKKAIVLTHGLIASPYSMRNIGEYFQSRCFLVLAVLLPEHATRPGDFLFTRWQHWAKAQHFAVTKAQEMADAVFIAGHSVGAELALYEAATNPAVQGLVLFAPAMEITPAAKYAWLFTFIGRFLPKAAWYELREDLSAYRYESITFSGADETYKLVKATQSALENKPLTIPVFMVASYEDNTVRTDTIMDFMAQQKHPASRTLVYSQIPRPSSKKVKVVVSHEEEEGVLSLSHLGLMLPASHLEYGRNGAYKSCGHYYKDKGLLEACRNGERNFLGEVTAENLLRAKVVERIAFNPFYDDLLMELDQFFESVALP